MQDIKIRINGRGNAWPVILGQDHPFYRRNDYYDLANSSFSIINSKSENPTEKEISWELMIDAGHGAVQYLLNKSNRIPEALFLTHPHIDHILGIDWIVQSYYKTFKKPFPVYSTYICWQKVLQTFPHLKNIVEFKRLVPFEEIVIHEVSNVSIKTYPVYHGQSAEGSVMLFFKIQDSVKIKKVLFTGDILFPLLRENDIKELVGTDILVTDANNRFPYPKSNHWSISIGINNEVSDKLFQYINETKLATILSPHMKNNISDNYSRCFDYFFNKKVSLTEFIFSVEEFVKRIKPERTLLVHYSGSEDENHYSMPRLNEEELLAWCKKRAKEMNLPTEFLVPYVGQHINLSNIK